jgi:putative transposase
MYYNFQKSYQARYLSLEEKIIMPIPISPLIEIPKEVYPILESISKSGKSEKRLVDRTSFVLRMGARLPNTRIAAEFKVETNTVKKWRMRWLEGTVRLKSIIESELSEKERILRLKEEVGKILADKVRPGAAMTYTPEQYCQILQVALEPPSQSGRPINDWTSRELAAEVNSRGICQNISASQVGRFLKRCRH